jgi:hypothetical protein
MPQFPHLRAPSAGVTRIVLAIFGLFAIGAMAGCAISGAIARMDTGKQMEGKVIDASTGLPLADVNVIATYNGENLAPGESRSVCRRLEYRKTNGDGMYRFPLNGDRPPSVAAFKYGYRSAARPLGVQQRLDVVDGRDVIRYYVIRRPVAGNEWLEEGSFATRAEAELFARYFDRYLTPAVGSRAERIEQLWGYVRSSGCDNGGDTRKDEVPYLRAVEAEMRDLSESAVEQKRVKFLSEIIEGRLTAR